MRPTISSRRSILGLPIVAPNRSLKDIVSDMVFRYGVRSGLILQMADGIYYRDAKPPFPVGPESAVTLAATDKLLWPGFKTALPANYLTPGKRLQITAYGTLTTGATPGNLGVELYFGTADAGGTLLASSAALTLVANQTTIPWLVTAWLRCEAVGTSGSVRAWGQMEVGTAVIAAGQAFIPASAPAAVTVDTTAASGFNVQFKRSGSTAESATTQDVQFEALN